MASYHVHLLYQDIHFAICVARSIRFCDSIRQRHAARRQKWVQRLSCTMPKCRLWGTLPRSSIESSKNYNSWRTERGPLRTDSFYNQDLYCHHICSCAWLLWLIVESCCRQCHGMASNRERRAFRKEKQRHPSDFVSYFRFSRCLQVRAKCTKFLKSKASDMLEVIVQSVPSKKIRADWNWCLHYRIACGGVHSVALQDRCHGEGRDKNEPIIELQYWKECISALFFASVLFNCAVARTELRSQGSFAKMQMVFKDIGRLKPHQSQNRFSAGPQLCETVCVLIQSRLQVEGTLQRRLSRNCCFKRVGLYYTTCDIKRSWSLQLASKWQVETDFWQNFGNQKHRSKNTSSTVSPTCCHLRTSKHFIRLGYQAICMFGYTMNRLLDAKKMSM